MSVGAGVPRNDRTNLQWEDSFPCLAVAPKISEIEIRGSTVLLKIASVSLVANPLRELIIITYLLLQCHTAFHPIVSADMLIRQCFVFNVCNVNVANMKSRRTTLVKGTHSVYRM